MKNSPALDIQNVSFGYGKGPLAVEGVSFRIAKQSTTILIGPNGSGKTTLLKLMIGLLQPTHGSITVLGRTPEQARMQVGYVPQKLHFDHTFPLTVREFLDLSNTGTDTDVTRVLADLDIRRLARAHVGTLSGGQLQRVLIARSLLGEPEILFLDEPASGIDIGGEQSFYGLITNIQQERGITVVMVSHQIGLVAQQADQVVCVNRTLLSSGPPDKKLTPKTIEKLFGEHVALHEHTH